ncbi:hypothetical protein OBA47_01805 [bacterium]|nr:hypothetical protein [bacterium]
MTHEKGKFPLLLPLIALLTACQNAIRREILPSLEVVGKKIEAETKKALNVDVNDNLEAFCKR